MLKRYFQIATNEPEYVFLQIRPIILYWLNRILNNYSSGYSFSLNRVFLILTFQCNLRCKMCVLWGGGGLCKNFNKELLNQSLSLDELKKIVDGFYKYLPSVILFGGEPLLYKDWYEISKYIKSKKLRLNLPTNGTLITEEVVEKLMDVMDNIDISLDGTEKIHDKIRGIPNTFKSAIDGIKLLNAFKEKKKLTKPYINICFTISEENYNNLIDFVEFLDRENIKINLLNFQHIEFTDADITEKQVKFFKENFEITTNFWSGVSSKKNKNIEYDVIIKQIENLKTKKYKNINYIEFEPDFTMDEIRNYYNRKNFKKPEKKCLAPYYEAMILPDGEVWICPDYSIGNVKHSALYNLWNNEKARKFRKILTKNKSLPVCGNCYTVYLYS